MKIPLPHAVVKHELFLFAPLQTKKHLNNMKVDVEKPLVDFSSLFGGWAVSLETPGFASPDRSGFAIVGELQKLFK